MSENLKPDPVLNSNSLEESQNLNRILRSSTQSIIELNGNRVIKTTVAMTSSLFIERELMAAIPPNPYTMPLFHSELVQAPTIMSRLTMPVGTDDLAAFLPLEESRIKQTFLSMTRSVKVCHHYGIVHNDIKTHNFIVLPDGTIRLSDFGLAERANRAHRGLVRYTHCYRPPEAWFPDAQPTFDVRSGDVWALGCTFVEMLFDNPLFSAIEPSYWLRELVGYMSLDPADFGGSKIVRHFFLSSHYRMGPIRSIGDFFANLDPNLIDLLVKMLVVNPNQRLTIDQVLNHRYFMINEVDDFDPELVEPLVLDPIDPLEFHKIKSTSHPQFSLTFLDLNYVTAQLHPDRADLRSLAYRLTDQALNSPLYPRWQMTGLAAIAVFVAGIVLTDRCDCTTFAQQLRQLGVIDISPVAFDLLLLEFCTILNGRLIQTTGHDYLRSYLTDGQLTQGGRLLQIMESQGITDPSVGQEIVEFIQSGRHGLKYLLL